MSTKRFTKNSYYLRVKSMIRLQRIYNFLLFHAIILPLLDVYGLYFTHLYHFWDYLLTGGPAHIAVFLPISVFRKKGISNGVQTEWKLRERNFRKIIILETWSPRQKILEEPRREGGTPPTGRPPIGRAPCLMDPSSTSRPTSFAYICLRTLKPSNKKIDREFHRRKPL